MLHCTREINSCMDTLFNHTHKNAHLVEENAHLMIILKIHII